MQLRLTSLAPLALVARNCIPMALNGPSNDPPLAIHVARGSPCSGPSEALHRGGPQWPPQCPSMYYPETIRDPFMCFPIAIQGPPLGPCKGQ